MSEQIRIVSDGTAHGTKVFTASGEDITHTVISVSLSPIKPSGLVTATIQFAHVNLDVKATSEKRVPPPAPMPDKGGLVGGKSSWAWPWK